MKYSFKTLTDDGLPLIFKWMNFPHVQEWWSDEGDWEAFCKHYKANMADDLVFPHLVYLEETPIGYINHWFVEQDDDFRPLYPKDTVGTDQFIGVPELIGKGHGSEFIKQFTDELLANENISLVITDPDAENKAAIRCYEKAGFQIKGPMKTKDGSIVLMEKNSPGC